MKRVARYLRFRVRILVEILRGIVGALRLVRDPNRLDDVFVIDRAVSTRRVLSRIAAKLRSHPATSAALDERRRLPRPDLATLSKLPEGSLGRSFADFMRARGLDPEAIPLLEGEDESEFVRAHLYDTHDLWHVVTGFDTDVAGELAVQAFYSAQLDGELPRILLIGGLINSEIKNENDWPRRLDAIARGWQLGRSARPLFGVRWDELWESPLDEVRRSLLLDVVPSAGQSAASSVEVERRTLEPHRHQRRSVQGDLVTKVW